MKDDPFASILELCHPTESQEARLPNCPMARQFEHFTPSDPASSSSLDPNTTVIVMVSVPTSPDSVGQSAFHTPPEHHPLSSSEDQTLGEGVAERESKRIRVDEEDTVPVGETETETETEAIMDDDTEVIVDLDEESGSKSNGKKIDECRDDGRRQLPETLKGKEKEEKEAVGSEATNSGTLNFVDIVRALVGNTDDGSEDDENEHWFDMIQRKGFTFPKPRWWP